jgi:hypothetical protein
MDASHTPQPRASSAEPRGQTTAPELDHEGGHGHSVAAWSSVGVIIAGSLIAAVAMVAAQEWLFVVGVVVLAVGAVLGKVLAAMGFGQPGRNHTTGAEGVR